MHFRHPITPLRAILLAWMLLIQLVLWGQPIIQGTVLDSATGTVMAGAHIRSEGSRRLVVSGSDGSFSISVNNPDTLVLSYVGYQTKRVPVLQNQPAVSVHLLPLAQLPEVVLLAPALQQEYNEPQPIGILSNRMLQYERTTALPNLLNRIPGVLAFSGAPNTNRITIRGIGSRNLFGTAKIRAYLDEIPLTNGSGETTLEDLDLGLLDAVTITRGPSPGRYGAGLGGIIRLSPAIFSVEKGSLWSNAFNAGSFGTLQNTHEVRLKPAGSPLSLVLQHSLLHSDGYRQNNRYDRQSITALAKTLAGSRDELTILAHYLTLKAGIPSSLNLNDFNNNPRKAADSWAKVNGYEDYSKLLTGISYRHYWSRGTRLSASLFGTYYDSYESRPFNILRETSLSSGFRMVADHDIAIRKQTLVLSAGVEVFREDYQWRTNRTLSGKRGALDSDNRELRRYQNAFVQAAWDLDERWKLRTALHLNTTHFNLTDLFNPDSTNRSGTRNFDPVLSPMASLSYRFGNETGNTGWVYLQVGHGYSMPTLEESLNPQGSVNPDLRPESSYNFEAGSKGYLFGRRVQYDISCYTMEVKDLLVGRRTADDQYIGINAGSSTHQGVEVSVNGILVQTGRLEATASLSYAYGDFRFRDFVDSGRDYSGRQLPGTARHTGFVNVEISWNVRYRIQVNQSLASKMPANDDNSVFSEGWSVTNAKLFARFFQTTRWPLECWAGIQNAFDQHYAGMLQINQTANPPRYYYPALPRNYSCGMRLGFRF